MKTDFDIQKDVMEELKWAPLLIASEIGVAVKNGIVSLSGVVDTYAKKVEAEKVARKVGGVKAVVEEIQVKIAGIGQKTDVEIAEAVVNALKWHSAVPEGRIKVKVENGIVALDGEVEWEYQKASARNAVINLAGVRGFNNFIKIVPVTISPLSASKVKSNIIKALHRRATKDAERINIETIGNKVVLSGTVHSLSEKDDAGSAAWELPGVIWVENNIEIDSEVLAF